MWGSVLSGSPFQATPRGSLPTDWDVARNANFRFATSQLHLFGQAKTYGEYILIRCCLIHRSDASLIELQKNAKNASEASSRWEKAAKLPKCVQLRKQRCKERASVRGVCGTDHSFTVHSEWTAEHLVKGATVLDKFLKHAFLRFKSCFHLVYKTLGFCFDLFIEMCFVHVSLSPSSVPPLHSLIPFLSPTRPTSAFM